MCEGMKNFKVENVHTSERNKKIVAFLCTWCSYAGADLAGTGRNQYPPNVRVIRVPCSGRINPLYIIKALLEGADGVMVSGCHPGDCHYLVGNYYARRRFVVLKKLLTTAGFEADRVHFTWVSASEGVRFADVVREVTERVSALGSSPAGFSGGVLREHSLQTAQEKREERLRQREQMNEQREQWKDQLDKLIPLCKKLLEDGTADAVLGFQEGGDAGFSIPCILDSPADADRLVWNARCIPNLSGYLCERAGITAIVAKPCDARAVVSLIIENQLKREDVIIIGMACGGMLNAEGLPLPGCLDCRVQLPPVYDIIIGGEAFKVKEPTCSGGNAEELFASSPYPKSPCTDESFERFLGEMEKCILCYSCRQSCYGCYCTTCFVERGEPDWQTTSPDLSAKMLYHLGRSTHLSGRCVECGACENACASGVDIRYLIKSVTNFIEETYGFKAGMDIEAEPIMLTYKSDDKEIGFLGNTDCAGGEANV